jgi:hypothetical protein
MLPWVFYLEAREFLAKDNGVEAGKPIPKHWNHYSNRHLFHPSSTIWMD